MKKDMFSNKNLVKLILPLIIEQLLAVLVGMVDGIMVSAVSESAMSGVSLVDQIGILLINVFTALATGGAVVAAQFIGAGKKEKACESANQLLLSISVLSGIIMVVALLGNSVILKLIFGHVSYDIMKSARIYFFITALSYPFLGIYNGCAALFRTMGNSKVSMLTSFLMNGINILGNSICIYGIKMGVEGVAIPTLIARAVGAIILVMLLRNQSLEIHLSRSFKPSVEKNLIHRILRIGVPSGIENGMFQLGKLIVQRWVTLFGDFAIAANTAAMGIVGVQCMIPVAIGVGMITVVGQCVGANDYEGIKKYVKKLMGVAYISTLIINVLMIIFRYQILGFYNNLSEETIAIAITLIIYHSVASIFLWPISFTLPNVFRAAGDVKAPMIISVCSMWSCRIVMSYVLGIVFNLGVPGIWIAMILDWLVRGTFFTYRYISKKGHIK